MRSGTCFGRFLRIFPSTELSIYVICYKNMDLHFLHVRNYALVVLLLVVLCRHSTLITDVNSCINLNVSITIIMFHSSKIREN